MNNRPNKESRTGRNFSNLAVNPVATSTAWLFSISRSDTPNTVVPNLYLVFCNKRLTNARQHLTPSNKRKFHFKGRGKKKFIEM